MKDKEKIDRLQKLLSGIVIYYDANFNSMLEEKIDEARSYLVQIADDERLRENRK